jgi:Zn-dependent metalloprotease
MFYLTDDIQSQDLKPDTSRVLKNARVTIDARTKIPQKIINMDVIPSILIENKETLTEKNIDNVMKSFLARNVKIFSVKPEEIKMVSATQRKEKWYVKYQQYYKNIPVYKSNVSFVATKEGRIQSYGSSYVPEIDVPIDPKISLENAIEIARKTYDSKLGQGLKERDNQLIIYPIKTDSEIKYHLAWKFLLFSEQRDPDVEKIFIIDAVDGQILKSYIARFPNARAKGKVQGEIYPINPTTPAISTEPLAHSYVDLRYIGTVETNLNGDFYKNLSWWWDFIGVYMVTFKLEGPFARVQNHNGSNYTVTRFCNVDKCLG